MSSFWDDLSSFGSGMLDDVGEGFGNLVNGWTTDDQTTNAGTTQQPETPIKDSHGNAVTGPRTSYTPPKTDKWVYMMVGVTSVVVLGSMFMLTRD